MGNRASHSGIGQEHLQEADAMLKWALIFFVISVIAGVLGFSGISAGAATIAKWLFFGALLLFVLFIVLAVMAGQALI